MQAVVEIFSPRTLSVGTNTSRDNVLIDLAADAKPPSGKRLFGGLNPINCSSINKGTINEQYARATSVGKGRA
jgi:hypothetical protein